MSRVSIVVSVLLFAISISALSVSLISASSSSQSKITGVPTQIAYQGYLEDRDGSPLQGKQTVHFNMYLDELSRSPIWQEEHSVDLEDGFFSVMLGSEKSISQDMFDKGSLYLSVAVGREAESVRQRLGSVPFAIMASSAHTANSLDCDGCVTSRQLADNAISGGGEAASLVSANGDYEIQITNDGIFFIGPDGELAFVSDNLWQVATSDDLEIKSERDLTLVSDDALNLTVGNDLVASANGDVHIDADGTSTLSSDSGTTVESKLTVKADAGLTLDLNSDANVDLDAGGLVTIDGTLVQLDGGCLPVARQTDPVVAPPPAGLGTITIGSATVSTC